MERKLLGINKEIEGIDKEIPMNYQVLNTSIDEVYKNPIHYNKIINGRIYNESSMPKLQWSLRYKDNVYEFIQSINRWNKDVFSAVEDIDKELLVLKNK